jgi:hypothetical protein
MATEELTIRVDPQAAAVYRHADEQQRRRLDLKLTGLARPQRTVEQIMTELSAEAQRNGLTPQFMERFEPPR